jgi:hypothetical protein
MAGHGSAQETMRTSTSLRVPATLLRVDAPHHWTYRSPGGSQRRLLLLPSQRMTEGMCGAGVAFPPGNRRTRPAAPLGIDTPITMSARDPSPGDA